MENNWKETQQLFSKLITKPPLDKKYLQKPSPSYIFEIIINTLKKTRFPNGLFTEEEKKLNILRLLPNIKRNSYN